MQVLISLKKNLYLEPHTLNGRVYNVTINIYIMYIFYIIFSNDSVII